MISCERRRSDLPYAKQVFLGIWAVLQFSVANCIAQPAGFSSPVPISQLYHESWTTRDGAPSSIGEVVQSSDGFLWIVADSGLYRFDGVSFKPFVASHGATLKSSYYRIFSTRDGSIWISYYFGGLSRIKDGNITNFGEKDGLKDQQISAFIEHPDGSIWVGGPYGVQIWRGSKWIDLKTSQGPVLNLISMSVDTEGNVWISSRRRLTVLPKGSGSAAIVPVSAEASHYCRSANDSGVWCVDIISGNFAVHLQWEDGHVRETETIRGNGIRSALDVGDGSRWVGTEHGVQQYVASHVGQGPLQALGAFTKRDGLTGDTAFSMIEDREGSVWVATQNGLDRFRLAPFRAIGMSGALPVQLSHGRIDSGLVVATDHLVDLRTGSPLSISGQFPGTWARSFFRSDDGSLWIGTTGHLLHFAQGKLVEHSLPSDFRQQDPPVLAITEDESHGLWISVAVGNGLFRFDGKQWIRRGGYVDLPNETALFTERDRAGNLWFGFRGNRVVQIRNGQVHKFESSSGLAIGDAKVLAGQGDNVWVGGDDGVAVFRGDRFCALTLKGGTSLRGVTGLAFAPDGALWINELDGVIRVAESDLATGTSGHAVDYQLFDHHDGLEGVPHALLALGSARVAADGKLYIANLAHLQWIDPLHLNHNDVVPPVSITRVLADKQEYPSPIASLAVKPNSEALQIDYSATSLLIPDRVRFRYQLEGYDRGWIDAGTRRQAFYGKLPPRNYRFKVVACNDSGVWNKEGASIGITVPPTFTQTVWFEALFVTAIAGAVCLAYALRVRQVTALLRKSMLERLSERERIARDLHDTFFQSVQAVLLRVHTATSGMPAKDPIRLKLQDALQQSDQVMREGRELMLDLRTTASNPKDLPAALADYGKQMQEDQSCGFEVVVNGHPRPLHALVYEESLRIGKEALSNAFRHSRARSIEAELNYQPNELRVRIRDNGDGINGVILKHGRREGHWGLPGMRERARKIGGRLDIWSRDGAGTEIELRVPASVAFTPSPGTRIAENGWRAFWRKQNRPDAG